MKQLFVILISFTLFKVSAQINETAFDGKNWEAPYHLDTPEGWDVERFLIPISFAPAIQYKGVEDIRFTPGWAKVESNEYWSYAFLWFLDGEQNFDSKILENNLAAYYTGLFNINTDESKIDTTKLIPVSVTINSRKAEDVDHKTFDGVVEMNDYITKKPITLNLIIHIKNCEDQNKTFAFFELSPKPYSDDVWLNLNQLWLNFKCAK